MNMNHYYDFVNASKLILLQHSRIEFWVVGMGGTGSWLAASVVRLACSLSNTGKEVQVTFVDHDVVEEANVLRQCFCYKEIGLLKAQTLALRYSIAWGMEIKAITKRFHPKMVQAGYKTLSIIIGCVDNASARESLSQVLKHNDYNSNQAPSIWYLDCGNSKSSGQVLLGSNLSNAPQDYTFGPLGCSQIPSPTIQHPELLVPLPEELQDNNLSCEQMALLNTQSLSINQQVAAVATDYLIQLTTGELKRFATYFDSASASMRSLYLTQESVFKAIQTL
ncbi:MAG: ThiF family adenylyltransferase [Tolypothrix carrinoi HA7290-LM1]|nr:ThiF family adenylyltransferase [Tolypothrix carrinoi HA7290-LM1]